MKVLVVDDEYYARKALSKIITEWDNCVQIIGDAENGQEALDIIREEMPDIVFADIRMPEVDGIELAKVIHKEYPTVNVVIISGYADFHYAQNAISYQVKQYILKPVKRAEIFKLMDGFREQSAKKILASENEKKLQDRIEISERLFIENKINNILYGAEQVDISAFKQLLSYSPTGLSFFTVVIQSCSSMNHNLKAFLVENIKAGFDGAIPFSSSKYMNELIFIKFLKQEDEVVLAREKMKLINRVYSLITKPAAEKEDQLSVGMSLLHEKLDELADSYREAANSLDYRLIYGWDKIYDYEAVNRKQKYGSLFDADMEKLLNANLYNGNADWVKSYIKRLFSGIKNNPDLSIAAIQDMISIIILAMNHVLKDINEAENVQKPHQYIGKIELHGFLFLNDLLDWILRQTERVCSFVVESKKSLDIPIIDDFKKFIHDNYCYDISLEGLAKHRYFVNTSYLSRLFKAETGQNFTGYLTELRMHKAIELIKEQTLGMLRIANLVGYYDLSHFIKSFKSFYGETPGQYRNRILIHSRSLNDESSDC